jgi:Sulfatase
VPSLPQKARDAAAAQTGGSEPSLWLVSLSLANLAYVKSWAAVLQTGRNITPVAFIAAAGNVLLLALLIRAVIALSRRTHSSIVRFTTIVAAAVIPVVFCHAIATIYFADDLPPRNATYAVGMLAGAAVISRTRARRWATTAVLVVSPLVAITFGQAFYRISSYDSTQWEPPALVQGQPGPSRLVWLLFDEWDYGLTFENPRVALPNVNRLLSESFQASNAYPPGPVTARSVPRLLTGEKSIDVNTLEGRPNAFSRSKVLGMRNAIVGWYIPYCRLFKDSVSACWSTDIDAVRNSMGDSILESAYNQLRNLFENQFRSPFGQPLGAKRHALDYKFVSNAAITAVSHPAFDFVYVHFPIPHEPLFYNSRTGQLNLSEKPLISLISKDFDRYMDAVQLVDRTLAELRGKLEADGLWDATHIVITSDHAYRNRHQLGGTRDDARVPFIVRVAGSRTAATFAGKFNTILTSDLAMALLQGELRTSAEVRNWVERHVQ